MSMKTGIKTVKINKISLVWRNKKLHQIKQSMWISIIKQRIFSGYLENWLLEWTQRQTFVMFFCGFEIVCGLWLTSRNNKQFAKVCNLRFQLWAEFTNLCVLLTFWKCLSGIGLNSYYIDDSFYEQCHIWWKSYKSLFRWYCSF